MTGKAVETAERRSVAPSGPGDREDREDGGAPVGMSPTGAPFDHSIRYSTSQWTAK